MFQWGNLSVNNFTDTKHVFSRFNTFTSFIFRKSISRGSPVGLPLPQSPLLSVSLWNTHTHTAKLVVSSLIQFLLSAIRSGFVSMSCPPIQSESIWMRAATRTVVIHGPSHWIYLVFSELSNVAAPQNTFNLTFVLLNLGLPKTCVKQVERYHDPKRSIYFIWPLSCENNLHPKPQQSCFQLSNATFQKESNGL